jgi:hypothetical protein
LRVLAAWAVSSRLGIAPSRENHALPMTPDRHSTVLRAHRSIGWASGAPQTELVCSRSSVLLLDCIHATSAGAGIMRVRSDLNSRSLSQYVYEEIQRAGSLHILVGWVCDRAALAPRPPEEPPPYELPPSCSPPWPTVNRTDHPEECHSMRAPPPLAVLEGSMAAELRCNFANPHAPVACCNSLELFLVALLAAAAAAAATGGQPVRAPSKLPSVAAGAATLCLQPGHSSSNTAKGSSSSAPGGAAAPPPQNTTLDAATIAIRRRRACSGAQHGCGPAVSQ